MVAKNGRLFRCGICGLNYAEKQWAERCEAWCRAHKKTCSVEITRHSAEMHYL